MKKIISLLLCICLSAGSLTGCGTKDVSNEQNIGSVPSRNAEIASETNEVIQVMEKNSIPKYIFLFIGDGMSYPQVQLTNYYLSAKANNNTEVLTSKSNLNYMDFPVTGSVQTYDSSSFCPDSASTATSISTGYKTYSGVVNMDETKTIVYETIAEKLKKQKDYKIGIISSVNLNHATPAAFYAHQPTRGNYYEIGVELVKSDFDYFGGGALLQPTGKESDQIDIYELADEAGYKVCKTYAEANSLKQTDGKAIVIAENLADSSAMNYQLDAEEGEWLLSDYVKKGIELLHNDTGFFMMVEGGKIDWSCHANDAGATINDTLALEEAVGVAIDFYEKYPDETLILVTGDHETGGLTIGFAGTNYDTFLGNLENQKISYAKFDREYVSAYKENNTSFEEVLVDAETLFGLTDLTEYESNKLKIAYERTMSEATKKQAEMTQEEYVLYGTYEPLTVTITHILNNKAGIAFTSYSHTALPVMICAQGVGAQKFDGYYDNTDIYNKLAGILEIQ